MLDHLATQALWVSLHTADPGLTGASEVVGAPYARQPVTWNPALESRMDSRNRQRFDLAAATSVTWVGLWTAESAGTFLDGIDSADITFVDAAGLVVSDIAVTLPVEVPVPIPATPVGLTGVAQNANTIRASWTTPALNADDYEVQISDQADPSLFESTGILTLTSPYDFTGLTASTSYWLRVLSHNASGFSPPSAVVGPTTTPAPPPVLPGDPSNLLAVASSSTQNDLTWTAGTNASTHNIQVSATSATAGFTSLELGWSGTTYSHVGLCPNAQRWYRVRARNDVGLSVGFSNVDDATTLAGAPPAIVDLTVSGFGSNFINLAWPSTCSANEYEIRRSTTGNAGTYAQIATTTGTTYSDTPLAPGVRRWYRVRAVLIVGATRFTSGDSNTVSQQTSASSASPCTTTDTLLGPTEDISRRINKSASNVATSWCLGANDNGSETVYRVGDHLFPPDGSTIKGEVEPTLGTRTWQGNLPAGRDPRFPETWTIRVTANTNVGSLCSGNPKTALKDPGGVQNITVENIYFDGNNRLLNKGSHYLDGDSVFLRCKFTHFDEQAVSQDSGRMIDCVMGESGTAGAVQSPTGSGSAAASKILTNSDMIFDHCYVYGCQWLGLWYDCHVGDETRQGRVLNKIINCWLDGDYPLHDTPPGPRLDALFMAEWEVCFGPAEFAYNFFENCGHAAIKVSGARDIDIHHNEFVNNGTTLANPTAILVKKDGRTPAIPKGEYRAPGTQYCGTTTASYDVNGVRFHHNVMNNHRILLQDQSLITKSTDPASDADFIYYANTGLAGTV